MISGRSEEMRDKEENSYEKLYYDSAYIRTFEAKVLSCAEGKKGYEVVLDQTAFSGGRRTAVRYGCLGGVPVTAVHEKNGEIIHYTDAPLTVGETVTGRSTGREDFGICRTFR